MKSSLIFAVNESINTTSSVSVEYTGTASQLLADLRSISVDADYSTENDGTLDCYGTVDGDSFRLAVTLIAG